MWRWGWRSSRSGWAIRWRVFVRGDWLDRMKLPLELTLVALIGLGAGVAAYRLSPIPGLLVLALAAVAIVVGSFALQVHGHVWWNWLVPVAVQLPLAAVWSTATRYASEARQSAAEKDSETASDSGNR